jgi:hypothetical protein
MSSLLHIFERVSAFTGLSIDDVKQVAYRYSGKYKRYLISKSSGKGSREIFHPCKQIKLLQYAISESVLRHVAVSSIARAYVRGLKSPLLTNAKAHSGYKFTVRLDFKNFFPSICADDLLGALSPCYSLTDSEASFLVLATFYKRSAKLCRYFLPIGAPSSPLISNIVMANVDSNFLDIAKAVDPRSALTRYADDLYFSSDKPGLCRLFHEKVSLLLKDTFSPCLSLNEDKTLYLSRGTRRIVTGLYITPSNTVSIGRTRKRLIKSLIYQNAKQQFDPDKLCYLRGLIAFVKDCEPEFYDRLAVKYGLNFLKVAC